MALLWAWQRLREGQAIVVRRLEDLPEAAEPEKFDLQERGVRSFVRVPLVQRGSTVGFLEIVGGQDPADWSKDSLRLLQVVGEAYLTALARKDVDEALRMLAQFDPLTGLANRVLLRDRIDGALARARRNKSFVALMFVDLDRFKSVNDSLGHDIGDALLKEVALRLRQCVREADTVARLGGDEFVVLLEGLKSRADAEPTARRVLQAMAQPFAAGGPKKHGAAPASESSVLTISASIGIALYPETAEGREALIRCADLAMYRVKRDGRPGYRFHENPTENLPG
jgi:diguanylate cyclase (GGDEF)-like protein